MPRCGLVIEESSRQLSRFVELERSRHDRAGFACGKRELDDFLKTKALRHAKAGTSKTLVLPGPRLADAERRLRILAFFSVSFATVERNTLPTQTAKRLPAYPVPVFLIAQLAVDQSLAGQGYGAITLYASLAYLARVDRSLPAAAVVVDCIDAQAASFYRYHGFESLTLVNERERLFLPMPTVRELCD